MKKYILHNKILFVLLVLLKALNTFVFLYFSVLVKDIINLVIENRAASDLKKYIFIGSGYCILLVVCYIAVASLHSIYMNKAMYLMKKDYITKLFNMPYEMIAKKESASYISALTNDMNMVRNGYLEEIFSIMDSVISIILAYLYICDINFYIALYVLIGASLLPFIPIAMEKKMLAADKALSDSNESFVSELKGILSGTDVIKTFRAYSPLLKRFDKVNKDVKKEKIYNDMLSIKLSSLSSTITNIIKIGLVILGVYFVLKGKVDIGSVTALFVLSSSFYNPVMSLCYEIGDIMGTKAIINKVNEVLSVDYADTNERGDEQVKMLCLKDVSYSYDREKDTLKNINLKMQMGRKYLIIGESGSGKTTLLHILLKMYSGYKGEILMNDKEYKSLNEEYIYEKIGYAQQKTYIFNGSLRDNIDINHTGNEKRLYDCIQKCQLEKFVNSLPNGLDTNIGEELNRISEGEKLRICLARTLYKNCDILLLDEITASLDVMNSIEIEKMILNITDKIIVNICHKFIKDSLIQYDQIIILENGEIKAIGNYEELKNNDTFSRYLAENVNSSVLAKK